MIGIIAPEIDALYKDVSDWVGKQKGWSATTEDTEPRRSGIGSETGTQVLRIDAKKNGTVYLEPQGYKKDGTSVVEMYAWPTLVRVRLLHKPNEPHWQTITDGGVPFHLDWNEQNFIRLVRDMMAAL
jgi:hypothetical protein